MNTYKIVFFGITDAIDTFEDRLYEAEVEHEDEEYIQSIKEDIKFFETLYNDVEIHTLDEYFNLIKIIDEKTDGCYHLNNGGKSIDLRY